MVTRVIPHDEWAEFLDDLSDLDETTLVSLEVLGSEIGDQYVARDLSLQGMTLVEKGSDAGEIEIILGGTPAEHFSHVVASPKKVSILETEEGLPQTLQIESDGGEPTVLVHFHTLPDEDVDEDEEEDE